MIGHIMKNEGQSWKKGWGNMKKIIRAMKETDRDSDKKWRKIVKERWRQKDTEEERSKSERKKAHVLSTLSGWTKCEPKLAVNPLHFLSCHSLRLQSIWWVSNEPCKNMKLYLVLIPRKKKSNVHMLSFSSSFGLNVL